MQRGVEMTIYVALLRGINVGGHNMIKMPELKRVLEAMGLANVQTYIQSGNVLFAADGEPARLEMKIEEEIMRVFGLSVPVVVRTYEELKAIVQHCPFAAALLAEGESIHVSFLKEAPAPEALARLNDLSSPPDELQTRGREIYMLFRQSILNSKLPRQLQRLGVPLTDRNWKTVTKLATMAEAIQDR